MKPVEFYCADQLTHVAADSPLNIDKANPTIQQLIKKKVFVKALSVTCSNLRYSLKGPSENDETLGWLV